MSFTVCILADSKEQARECFIHLRNIDPDLKFVAASISQERLPVKYFQALIAISTKPLPEKVLKNIPVKVLLQFGEAFDKTY
jgi:hypothetical protein